MSRVSRRSDGEPLLIPVRSVLPPETGSRLHQQERHESHAPALSAVLLLSLFTRFSSAKAGMTDGARIEKTTRRDRIFIGIVPEEEGCGLTRGPTVSGLSCERHACNR